MITINLSEKDSAVLKSIIMKPMYSTLSFEQMRVVKEVGAQINNQQFNVSDFESSRQYEALSVKSAGFIPKTEFSNGKGWRVNKSPLECSYLENWDKATKK